MPAGEPRLMRSVRVSPEAMTRVEALADKQGRTVSDVMRRCLARGLVEEEAEQAAIENRRR